MFNLDPTGLRMGLGCMRLSYPDRVAKEQAEAVIVGAYRKGVRLFDTADCYSSSPGMFGENERLLSASLGASCLDAHTIVATKGGLERANPTFLRRGDPDYLLECMERSAEALGRKVDLWFHHGPDEKVPLRDSLVGLEKGLSQGLVSNIGISNYSLEQVTLALSALPIVAVQNPLNLWNVSKQRRIVELTLSRGVWFVGWAPLGGRARTLLKTDLQTLERQSQEEGLHAPALMVSYLKSLSPNIIPIIGCHRVEHLNIFDNEYDCGIPPKLLQLIRSFDRPEGGPF